jgi:hypothetical protein
MKYSNSDLLAALDGILCDYGNREIQFPESLSRLNDSDDFYEEITEAEALEIFEFNDGDIESTIDYIEDSDEI